MDTALLSSVEAGPVGEVLGGGAGAGGTWVGQQGEADQGSAAGQVATGQVASAAQPLPTQAAVQSAEEVFVEAFYACRLVRECMDARKGKPGMPGGLRSSQSATTIGAVIRRWFIGRQTIRKAEQKTDQLSIPLSDHAIAQDSALVGTAAMLDLTRLRPELVWVADSSHAGYIELTMAIAANKWGRPAGDRPEVTNRRYFIDKRVRDACEGWAAGYEARQLGRAQVKTEVVASQVKTEVVEEQAKPINMQSIGWWADEGEGSDSHSSIGEGEVPWDPAEAYGQLDRSELTVWESADIAGANGMSADLNDNWMQWALPLPPLAEVTQHAVGASVEVLPKRPRSPEQAMPQKHIKTEDERSDINPSRSRYSVARGAMQLGLAFLAVSTVSFLAVSRYGHPTPGDRPSDGWNCDHGEDITIMFAGKKDFCAADHDAVFPCPFDCPAGSIGVGRSCRCDGCYRDGHCMHWVMNGHSPSQYNESVADCPEPVGFNASVEGAVEWPAWWQTPDKVPGVPNQGGAIWHDNTNNRLLVTLFPAGSKCPDEECARLVARGARSYCNDALGACPLDGSQSVAGVWSWDLSDDSTYRWTRVIGPGDLASSPEPRNNALAFPGAASFFIFGGRSWIQYFGGEIMDYRCTSDMWVLTSSDHGSGLRWTQLSWGKEEERYIHNNTTNGKQPQWPAGNSGRTAWSAPCEDGTASTCTERLWMFGGQADNEVGPVNALWAYEYGRPEELGTWTLVTGSTYDVVEFALTEKLQPLDRKHALYNRLQAVDQCGSSWPLESRWVPIKSLNRTEHYDLQLHWLEPGEARCPAARYAAASWSTAESQRGGGGAYIFGGLTVWQPTIRADFERWRNHSMTGIPDQASTRVRALQDLWHFNGNPRKPRWTQVHQSQTAWPPAAIGHGWNAAGQLWLWVSWVGPQRVCTSVNCSTPTSTYRYVNSGAANELWVFSPLTEVWERVTQSGVDGGNVAPDLGSSTEVLGPVQADAGRGGSSTREFGAWPGARQGELMDGGYLFSGLGNYECATADGTNQAPGDAFTRPLSGLWRWAPFEE